jgi:hypothetical protein
VDGAKARHDADCRWIGIGNCAGFERNAAHAGTVIWN